MTKKADVQPYYQKQAKDVVDMLFDKRLLADDLSRETVKGLEDLMGYLFQTQAETAVQCALLTKKSRDIKKQ